MLFFVMPILLLCISRNTCVKGQDNIYLEIENDLKKLNLPCHPDETCEGTPDSDSESFYSCQCGTTCVQLGTCCRDSVYRFRFTTPPKIRPTCRSLVNENAYFMVDRCPSSNDNTASAWKNLCEEEWNDYVDVMSLVPVTSLLSNTTYKNYFCFRCHETTNDFFYWNLTIEDSRDHIDRIVDEDNPISLKYDRCRDTWAVPVEEGQCPGSVRMEIEIPEELRHLAFMCDPDVISHCSDKWLDKDVSDKCEAYLDIIHVRDLEYKNAHCALCNFVDPKAFCHDDDDDDDRDGEHPSDAWSPGIDWRNTVKHVVSPEKFFRAHCGQNSVWIPSEKKCREL